MVRAVVFDLGNVLIDFDHTIAARRIAQYSAKSPEEIYQLFFDSPLTGLFEEGKIAPLDFFSQMREKIAAEISYEEFVPIWNEIFFLNDRNHRLHALARVLRRSYTVAVLSNVNTLHFSFIREHFAVLQACDRVFASCEMQAKKPDPAIYTAVLRELAVAPEQCFYTDDRPELIEAARSLGIRGYVYRGPEQLTVDLAACQIRLDTAEGL